MVFTTKVDITRLKNVVYLVYVNGEFSVNLALSLEIMGSRKKFSQSRYHQKQILRSLNGSTFPFHNTPINSVMNSGTIKSSTIQYIEIELREGEASQVVAGVFTINCNCKVIRYGQSKDFKNGILSFPFREGFKKKSIMENSI